MSSVQPEVSSTVTPQGSSSGALRRLLELVARGTDAVAFAVLLLLLSVVFAMVVTRSVFSVGLAWLDDLARYLQIWLVYTAAITITMRGEHIAMDAFYIRMPRSWRLVIRRFTGLISLVVSAIAGFLALQQAIEVVRSHEVSSSGVLPAIVGYASLPFGFGFMVGASVYYLLYRTHQDDVVS